MQNNNSSEEVAKILDDDFTSPDIPKALVSNIPHDRGAEAELRLRGGHDPSSAPHFRLPVCPILYKLSIQFELRPNKLARKSGSRLRPKPSFVPSDSYTPNLEDDSWNDRSFAGGTRFRKRNISTDSTSSSRSSRFATKEEGRRSSSKRPRILDQDEDTAASENEFGGASGPLRQSRRSYTRTPLWSRRSSESSNDPIDGLTNREGDSVSPVGDLAGDVGKITIAPHPGSKYPVEVGRYFVNRNRPPQWYHVKDIPKDLINEINDIPDWCRNPDLLRQIFEAAILQNTTEDEPEAPAIRIINEIDDEPTPPFEFYYTNRMYHGDGVPPPDYSDLQGCTCIGTCDPRSNTCACVRRHQEIYERQQTNHRGFIYDEKGRMCLPEYPIFECNDACGCTDDCMNRVRILFLVN